MVTAGFYDVVLACGSEKMYLEDKAKVFAVFEAGADVEQLPAIIRELEESARASGAAEAASVGGNSRSMFMDLYARVARDHMAQYGSTAEQFAMISAKNSLHGSLNPRAQFQNVMSVEEVLAAPMIAEPLTRPMCAPIGDGAAAVIIVSERKMRELGLSKPVRVVSSVLRSGWDHDAHALGVAVSATKEAYEETGIDPNDLSLVEMHDASAPAELMGYEYVGLCPKGEGGRLISDGETEIGGHIPVNPSGGRLRMGHPLGATGIAQVIEVTEQLQGRSGPRQVANARIGLCHNGGGNIGADPAAQTVAILTSA
jgi:acetyl-CoA acetyltransferase